MVWENDVEMEDEEFDISSDVVADDLPSLSEWRPYKADTVMMMMIMIFKLT